ncbi:MAG TPA: hypothetical protein VGV61_18710, partial [Thermoanaerobaculia bacterium]|nr:hypothetical protein [Thermoanaerobaculia bacterium]
MASSRPPWRSAAAVAGLAAVAAARLLSLPATFWELDEVLFVRGVERFDPLHHRPHPPGYPLTIGLGKLARWLTGDPFAALVAVSVVASLVGYLALVDAFARLLPARWSATDTRAVAVGGALLFALSPSMLVHGPLALSDAPAMAFVALALAAAARLGAGGGTARSDGVAALALGGFAAAAIGCRPQLAVAVVPMVVAALVVAGRASGQAPPLRWKRIATSAELREEESASPALHTPDVRAAEPATPPRRNWLLAAIGFGAVALAWLWPLVAACGGPRGLVGLLRRQAGLVAAADADAARAGFSRAALLARFVAHPWGPKALALPVLVLALLGAAALLRSGGRRALPLLVLAAANLAFALAVMDPGDAVRYALPTLLGVAFLAAVGLRALATSLRAPAAMWAAVGVLAAGFVAYTLPLLHERRLTPSPPAQALAWAAAHLPRQALLVIDPPLAPHAAEGLADRDLALADPGLSALARAGDRPAWLLADGDSRWPGAVTFAWPPSDAYGKLTRGYYRVVTWSPIPPACAYDARRGVYGWEPSPRQPQWRWLDEEAVLRLAPRGAAAVELVLGLPASAPAPTVVAADVAGGVPLIASVPRGGSTTLRFRLPPP